MILQGGTSANLPALLNKEFPGQAFTTCVLNHDGWDNLVAELDGEWIFRFPKSERYKSESELKVLEQLHGRLKVPIPKVQFVSKNPRCMGYRKIGGVFIREAEWPTWSGIQIDALAEDLAGFLYQCHQAVSVNQAKGMGLEHESSDGELDSIVAACSSLGRDDIAKFSREAVAAYRQLPELAPSFLYDDLHSENFLIDPASRRLAGVVDFGDCAWGDVHYEFHPLYRYDRRIFEKLVTHYERLSGLALSRRRCVIYSWFDALGDIAGTMHDPENGARKNAFRWLERYMERRDDYQ